MTAFPLDEFLPYRLAVASARVSRAFERRYRAEAGISVPEWRVLAHLSQQAEVSVREIEARGPPAAPHAGPLPDGPASQAAAVPLPRSSQRSGCSEAGKYASSWLPTLRCSSATES